MVTMFERVEAVEWVSDSDRAWPRDRRGERVTLTHARRVGARRTLCGRRIGAVTSRRPIPTSAPGDVVECSQCRTELGA